MQNSNNKIDDSAIDSEQEIGLFDLVNFIQNEWKTIIAASITGSIIGISGWIAFADYKAEGVMLNNGRAIDFVTWRALQKNLPLLAAQLKEKDTESVLFSGLDNPNWWQKNVVPNYSLSKADTKDLIGISKELQDTEGQNILSLTVTTKGSTKDQSLSRLEATTHFISEGSAYLLLKNLINEYEFKVLNNDADLQKKITDAEVELRYLQERAIKLERLRRDFPANVAVNSQQVVDLKDSSAKYMPISTQLVAVNTDINATNESLERMKKQLSQAEVLRKFLSLSKPLLLAETSGLKLASQLLDVEAKVRKQEATNDINALQLLNTIRSSIVSIQSKFTNGLESALKPVVSKTSPLPSVGGGLAFGALLGVIYALGRKALIKIKTRSAIG